VAVVVLAVLSNAQDSAEDGEEKSVGGGSMPPEKQANRQTEAMVKLVETEAKSLLKSRNITSKKFKAVSYRTLQGKKGKTHFVKVCTFLIDQMYFRDSNGNDNKNLSLLFSWCISSHTFISISSSA